MAVSVVAFARPRLYSDFSGIFRRIYPVAQHRMGSQRALTECKGTEQYVEAVVMTFLLGIAPDLYCIYFYCKMQALLGYQIT